MKQNQLLRRDFLKLGLSTAALSGLMGSQFLADVGATQNIVKRSPNLLIFLSDDHAYADISCIGTKDIKTPNLDKLASLGTRFTNFYVAAPVCGPSRAALMSGRYPLNAGFKGNIRTRKDFAGGLSLKVPIMSEALKKQGYKTSIFGKWHLGPNGKYLPDKRGFDYWFGLRGGCVDFFSHILYYEKERPPLHDLYENGEEYWANGKYLTELITEKATDYFNKLAAEGSDQPFFSYVSYTDPHYPMHTCQKYMDRFPDLDPERRIMAAKVSALDDSIGAIMQTLEKNGQLENTVVLFMSDNGPSREVVNWLNENTSIYRGGNPGGFRGHKYSLFEGGIRVPAIISWPGHIPAGKVCDEVAASIDVFPTFLKLAEGSLDEYQFDGLDIMPMLLSGGPSPHENMFWEVSAYPKKQLAVRQGRYKLVINGFDLEGVSKEDEIHLSDLVKYGNDRVNLAAQMPEKTKELEQLVRTWYADITKQGK